MRYQVVALLSCAVLAGICWAEVCPNGHTCYNGSCCPSNVPGMPYGCCPFVHGVCCADMQHCCPLYYRCDLPHLRCLPGIEGLPELPLSSRHQPHALTGSDSASASIGASESVGEHPCPDGKKTCGDGATCCELAAGGYACCPEANGVCCSDHIHCCPAGTKCDMKNRSCVEEKRHRMLNML